MGIDLRAIAFLTALTVSSIPAVAQQDEAAPGASLSKTTRKALDNTFKKWQPANVDPQSAACRREAGPPPALVQADLNGDGQPDVALALKAADGVHLVVVFERLADSIVVDVDRLGQDAADGYLMIEPRGSSYSKDGLEDYFTANTLAVYRCGQPRTVYFWSGLGFRKLVLPDTGPT